MHKKASKMYLILILFITSILIAVVVVFSIPPLVVHKDGDRNNKINKLHNWLNKLHSRGKFNGVVLLSVDGDVVLRRAYGFADVDDKKHLNEHSSFNLASVSKQFVAAGVVLLKHQGKLSYADKLGEYIPELSFYGEITIRHLLNHTSGIPDYLKLASDSLNESEIVTVPKLIAIYASKKPQTRFRPGEKFEYNNMGYVLLAEIIERVTNMKFSAFMEKNIFQPLGMTHTTVFNLLSENEPENRVYGFRREFYLFGRKVLRDLNRFDGVVGDGGIYSCAYDLFVWHKALLAGNLIPVEEMAEAYRSGFLNNGKKTGYGFGWFINDDGSVEHAGGWQGFATYFWRDLSTGHMIVVLDNSGNIFRVTSNGVRYNSIPLNLKSFIYEF